MATIEFWHYFNAMTWQKRIFGKTISSDNLLQDGKMFQAPYFFKIDSTGDVCEYTPPNREDTFYVQLLKNNEQYLLPKKFVDKLPIMIKKNEDGTPKTIDLKIKKADKDFWHYITGVDSYSVPPKRLKDFKWTIDNFNPLKHINPRVGTFFKLVAFSRGLKMGFCGNAGCGKNANLTLLEYLLGDIVPDLVPCSKPVFYKYIKFNHHVNVDEATSWNMSDMALLEDDIKTLGEGNPKKKKNTLNSRGQLDNVDIRNKGLTFTFNPITPKNPKPFHEIFSNFDKIEDRFALILVPYNKIQTYIPMPSEAESEAIVEMNLKKYNLIAQNIKYHYFNIDNEMHNWDHSKNPFSWNIRFMTNTMPLIRTIDAYSQTQEQFDEWMVWIKGCEDAYKKMIRENEYVPQHEEETKPEKENNTFDKYEEEMI